MEILSVVEKVLEYTVVPVGRQLGYVFCYNGNINGLKKKAEKLNAARTDTERKVVAARNNNEEIKEIVKIWMREVDEITAKGEKFFEEESQANTVCSLRSCPNLWLRYKLSRKAKKMAAKVDKYNGDVEKCDVSTGRKLPPCCWDTSTATEAFESRVSTMKEIMDALIDPAVQLIGLCGLGGVGKTTLAKQVAKKAQDEKLFDRVLVVEVKHNSIKDIQSQIAVSVGLNFSTQSETELTRANELRMRMEQEKSLLIVLDDLWERLDFKQVGIPSADDPNTQRKFIFTSRDARLLSGQMNCKRNILLGLLSEEEAWVLFKKMAEINEHSDDSDLVSKAKEVSQKCAQLPVAIVVVARALRNDKSLEYWTDALQRLKGYSSRNFLTAEVDSSIRLSYDILEKKELKPTFLLSTMFSQDPLVKDLFMYAVGLGYLEDVHSMEGARIRLEALVHRLKALSLLLDSYSKDRFTIHDVVRDVVLSIAFGEQHALVKRCEKVDEWPNVERLEECIFICLDRSDIDELPEELYGPKVEFFYLDNKDQKLSMPSNFFRRMQELKVLSLSNMTFSSLPSSISLLQKLITLSLDSCVLEDISVVENLKNLKILNLSFSSIEELPCEVGQLSSLKILNLSWCHQLKVIPANLLSNLKKLEELYMERSFNRWKAKGLNEGEDNASLDELKNLQKLSALVIDIPNASVLPKDLFLENLLERYKISIGGCCYSYCSYEFSRTLRLAANSNINMEYGVFRLFESVEDLYLQNLNGIASLHQSHITAQTFRKLRAIKVSRCDQLKSLFLVYMAGTLSKLETIEVSECMSLEEIVAFSDEEIVEKGSTLNVIEFLQLRSLKLKDLPALTDFCFNKKVAFLNLETLHLTNINCQSIWAIFVPKSSETQISEIVESSQIRIVSKDPLPDRSFSNLKTLVVVDCKFLLKLIPLYILKSLSNLEELEIKGCDLLEGVFDFGQFNNYKETHAFHLKRLILKNLPKLKTVWGRGSQGIVNFSSLQKVYARECKSLENIFPVCIAKGLVQFEELQISDCGIAVVVAKDEFPLEPDTTFVFLKLRKLEIRNCNNLKIFQSEVPDTKYSLFLDEKVMPKLEELSLIGMHAKMMWNGEFRGFYFLNVKFLSLSEIYGKTGTFPYSLFHGFANLEQLQLCSTSSEVIFSCSERSLENDAQKTISIKRLKLSSMRRVKHIWDGKCQVDHILQNLETLYVDRCHRLINLGSSFVSLQNLTDLDVSYCDGLINLLAPSTARTLVQLTRLKIKKCKKIEEIITDGENNEEKDIVFMKLKILKLNGLSSCRSFCCHSYNFEFPILDEVIIRGCLRLKMFCPGSVITPLLKGVKVVDKKIHWQSNLNKTIQQLFDKKVLLTGEDVKIDEYPELIDIWNEKCTVSNPSFSNLKSLIMDKCAFLSKYVIPSHVLISLINLESLEVRNCESVEVVFDLEGIDIDKEAHTLQAIPLWRLELQHLPNLKCVWNKDPHTVHCFPDLRYMSAYECESLRSIFPASIAKGLINLFSLKIESCGVEVIVAEDHTPSPTIHFVFPALWRLHLIKLPNLKNFYPQRHTVEWPGLKYMDVRQCKKMKVFSWEDAKITEKETEDGVENQYPLFLLEKVFPKLCQLVLNQDHVKMLRNDQFQYDLFNKVEKLSLDSFSEDELLVFPYAVLEKFPELKYVDVSHSSFKDIFACQGHPSDPSRKLPLLTSLSLTHLDQLQNIWNKDSNTCPVLQSLERLDINHCYRLINLAPSSASFDNLNWLTVSSCHHLGYLLTTSTTKSLVHLQTLMIKDCEKMEEIVTNEGKDLEDIIRLGKLDAIELIDLPVLRNFCSQICTFEFPSLTDVTIRGCSKMKMFCLGALATPLLEDVKVEEDEECWEGDLNKTLEQIFLEKEGQNSLEG